MSGITIKKPEVLQSIIKPEFIRLPKNGTRCPHTGLSRSGMSALVLGDHAVVTSVVLRQRGASKGVRLVNYDSLITYLHGVASR